MPGSSENPFGQRLETNAKLETEKLTFEMMDLHIRLVGHIWGYVDPRNKEALPGEDLKIDFQVQNREIKFNRYGNFGSICIESTSTESDKTNPYLMYSVGYARTPEYANFRDASLYYQPKSPNQPKIEISLKRQDHQAVFQEVFGRRVWGLEDDGLHVASQEQVEWDSEWRDFIRNLLNYDADHGEKFDDFLQRNKKNQDAFLSQFKTHLTRVENAESFLRQLRDFWKLAYNGKDLPNKLIPKLKGDRPKDDVYSHENTQKFLKELMERLQTVIHLLDGKLGKPIKPHPYR